MNPISQPDACFGSGHLGWGRTSMESRYLATLDAVIPSAQFKTVVAAAALLILMEKGLGAKAILFRAWQVVADCMKVPWFPYFFFWFQGLIFSKYFTVQRVQNGRRTILAVSHCDVHAQTVNQAIYLQWNSTRTGRKSNLTCLRRLTGWKVCGEQMLAIRLRALVTGFVVCQYNLLEK